MNYIKLQNEKLDVGSIQELVADESCGAISLFVGTTRDNFDNKKVICLEYEAYEPMALKVLNKICDDIRTKWTDVKNIAIYHRLGIVPVKEASVVIAISCPHRFNSIQSLQYAIDELKRTVPIWKKEKYENDTTNSNGDSSISSRIKIVKKSKLNFTESCNIENFIPLPKNFIQINANEDELKRRIQCFIDKKREENDINNILDFIPSLSISTVLENKNEENFDNENVNENEADHEKYETCARVNSSIIRQNDSKGHLKVYRVKNEFGPQIVSDYTSALDKLTNIQDQNFNIKSKENLYDMKEDIKSLPIGISERLEKVENFLKLPLPVSKDIYQRLKQIEDKIKFLETVSPEYRHFMDTKTLWNEKNIHKRKYTIQDLDNYISIFKAKK